MTTKIVIYDSMLCGFCRAAKRLLDSKGWEYESISIDGAPATREEMIERAGRTSVPQIFFDDHHVGGFDDLAELAETGDLDSLYKA